MMSHVFYKNRNIIGQLMIALMFVSGSIFMFTFDGFVSEVPAASCCGGGEAVVTSFAADSSGDFGSDVPMDAEVTSGCCGGKDISFLQSSSGNNGDSDCTCLADDSGSSGSCGACDDGNGKCSSSSTPSSCKSGCAGDYCGEAGYCDEDDATPYCPNDPDANRYYCDGDSDGCDKEGN